MSETFDLKVQPREFREFTELYFEILFKINITEISYSSRKQVHRR